MIKCFDNNITGTILYSESEYNNALRKVHSLVLPASKARIPRFHLHFL